MVFQKIIPRTFIVILILGVLWAAKAIHDAGLFSNLVWVLVIYLSGGVMIYLGMRMWNKAFEVLGQVLIGGGIATSLIATFLTHAIFEYINGVIALTIYTLIILGGMYFTRKYRSQSIGILASLAVFLTPFLVISANFGSTVTTIHSVILYALFIMFAGREKFPILYYTSIGFTYLTAASSMLEVLNGEYGNAVILLLVAHIAIFFNWLLSYHEANVREQMLTSIISLSLFVYWNYIFYLVDPTTAVIFAIALIVAYGMAFLLSKSKGGLLVKEIYGFLVFAGVSALALPFDGSMSTLMLCFSLLIGYFILLDYKGKELPVTGITFYSLAMLASWFQSDSIVSTLNWILILVSLFIIHRLFFVGKNRTTEMKVTFYLYTLFSLLVTTYKLVNVMDLPSDYARISLSFFWFSISIGYLVVSGLWKMKVMSIIGLSLLGFVMFKFILFDLFFVAIALRAILFIVIGILGLVVSRMFYKSRIKEKETDEKSDGA